MRQWMISLRVLLAMTLLTGAAYPLAVTLLAQGLWPAQARGSLVLKGSQAVGSALLAQKTSSPDYFWSRPSAGDPNVLPSGGSNLGPTSAALKQAVDARRAELMKANPGQGEPPADLLFASGSGLDPHISPEAARWQAARVARARRLDEVAVAALVEAQVQGPQWGLFGQPRVNVLALNLALDGLQ